MDDGYMDLALNPRAMDDKTKPNNIYTTPPTNISNEKINDSHDGVVYDQLEWGETGAITQFLNIVAIVDDVGIKG
jgi:hypothetical protein